MTPTLDQALSDVAYHYGWSDTEARERMEAFYAELQPRLDDLTLEDIMALFHERHVRVTDA